MIIDIKIPSPGESISEVELAQWNVKTGDVVTRNTELGSIESDKASLPLIAEEDGKVILLIEEGSNVLVGTVACQIDTSVKVATPPPLIKATPPTPQATPSSIKVTPVAQALMEEAGVDIEEVIKGLRHLNTEDVKTYLSKKELLIPPTTTGENQRGEQRVKMSNLRTKLAERLVKVKNETAMLTTFNEVDMSALMSLKKLASEQFLAKHGIKLGLMSFFSKAVAESLKLYPMIHSMIDGNDIITPQYVDISIAVSAPSGLVVPVVRDVQSKDIAAIEQAIAQLAEKARNKKLTIEEMQGGTFTITNGGVFGSLMSTPIINPPQSAILGMHNIVERPIALNGQVVIRQMMYIALSYDHRIIDGKDSVSFLKQVKEFIEHPAKLFLNL